MHFLVQSISLQLWIETNTSAQQTNGFWSFSSCLSKKIRVHFRRNSFFESWSCPHPHARDQHVRYISGCHIKGTVRETRPESSERFLVAHFSAYAFSSFGDSPIMPTGQQSKSLQLNRSLHFSTWVLQHTLSITLIRLPMANIFCTCQSVTLTLLVLLYSFFWSHQSAQPIKVLRLLTFGVLVIVHPLCRIQSVYQVYWSM